MNKSRRRALGILSEHGPLTPGAFARLMWPDSPAWRRVARRHDGISGALGAGLVMSAGAFLGRMEGDGLLYRSMEPGSNAYRVKCLESRCKLEPGHLGAHVL